MVALDELDAIAINAGGPALGNFIADTDFAAANSWEAVTTHAIDISGIANPGPAGIYQSSRISPSMVYTIGALTANKPYMVRLSFAECYWTMPGQRLITATINSARVLTSFDIFAAAGAEYKAVAKTFAATTSASGQIVIALRESKDNAEISAIEVQNIQPSAAPSPSPNPSPSPSPAPTNSPAPSPSASGLVDAPAMNAALICVHFKSNPMCSPLPSSPAVSGSSAQWATLEFQSGHDSFGGPIQTNVANPYLDGSDTSEPGASISSGVKTISQRIECSLVSYGPPECTKFGLEGALLNVPANMLPEGNHDHHYTFDSTFAGGEYDFWLTNAPGAAGAELHMGTAGFCKWGSDATGCSNATASKIATSMGGLDPILVKAGESSPNGTLGYALSSTALCAAPTWVYPATDSDGFDTDTTPACLGNTGAGRRPPEGTRWFLDRTDVQINALSIPPYAKVILRTMDKQHYGGTIVDTNWQGAPGLSIDFHRGNYSFMATEAGIGYATNISIPIYTTGLNLATSVKFCSNGTC